LIRIFGCIYCSALAALGETIVGRIYCSALAALGETIVGRIYCSALAALGETIVGCIYCSALAAIDGAATMSMHICIDMNLQTVILLHTHILLL
jgi:hypothetical protein